MKNIIQIPLLKTLLRCFFVFVFVVINLASKEAPKSTILKSEGTFLVVNYNSNVPSIYRSENLDLEELPEMQELFNIAKYYMEDYAVFFIAVKMMESGADRKPSWLATNHHNLVGMRFPKKRETYAIGATNTNYAIYRNWFEGMLDFKIYTEQMELSFKKKNSRKYKNAYEMLDHFYGFYNSYEKWYNDIKYLIGYVERKYNKSEEEGVSLIFD